MSNFWETKELKDFTAEEWEALCDGCGRCCYRKIITGWFWWKKILNTRIACNLLDCQSCKCTDYTNRFAKQPECIKLSKKNIKEFNWLPETCAYRLIFQHKPLPSWHPLISKNPASVKEAGIQIQNGINEKDADNWFDYIIQ